MLCLCTLNNDMVAGSVSGLEAELLVPHSSKLYSAVMQSHRYIRHPRRLVISFHLSLPVPEVFHWAGSVQASFVNSSNYPPHQRLAQMRIWLPRDITSPPVLFVVIGLGRCNIALHCRSTRHMRRVVQPCQPIRGSETREV